MRSLVLSIVVLCSSTVPVTAQPPLKFIEVPVVGDEVSPPAAKGGSSVAFRGAPRCDSEGTVLLVPLDSNGTTASRVVRIARTGRRTVFDLAKVVEGARAAFQIAAVSLDSAGTLHALVDLGDFARRPPRKVVAVAQDGTSLWERELDESGIHVKDFAVLASGDVLLVGVEPQANAAVTALLHREGGQGAVQALPGARNARPSSVVSGPHGVFVVDDKNNRVVQIGGDNRVVRQFALAPVSPQARLIGAQISGTRIAALDADMTRPGEGVRRFVSLQSTAHGTALRTLGPFGRMVVCYAAREGRDEVTLLSTTRTGWMLVRAQ